MVNSKVKISTIIERQLPSFVREDYPLVSEFLKQYYISLEGQSLPLDLIENLDQYIKLDELTNLTDSTTLTSVFDYPDDTLNVESTYGFPDSYGLILIDDEIITYTSKTDTTFEGCIRGFSGITEYDAFGTDNELIFQETQINTHDVGSVATNLSILFLKQFFIKLKKQIAPGFEERELYSSLNQAIFFKQVKDFYSTKGTDESFRILFKALYGDIVEVVKPRDFLISPSDAQYNTSKNLIVEALTGDPLQLINRTLNQDSIYSIPAARGVVSKVEKIRRNDKTYYVLSLDYGYNRDIEFFGTLYGEFSVHPRTKIINSVSSSDGVVSIDVDSTVGFPNSGELVASIDGVNPIIIQYESKTLTQFLNCSGVTENLSDTQDLYLNVYAYGNGDNDNIIQIKINAVISDLEILDDTFLLEKDDSIKIKTLGKDSTNYKSNNWIFNYPITYEVKNIELLSSTDKTLKYKITLYDDHIFKINDQATLIASNNITKNIKIERFENKNNFIVITDRVLNERELEINESIKYRLKKKINKLNIFNNSELSKYNTDIQNIYIDSNEDFYVTSSSLPSYTTPLQINEKIISFSGTFNGQNLNIGKHNFYTGDSVFYTYDKSKELKTTTLTYLNELQFNNLGIEEGIYYIYRVDNTTVRLARSKDDIFKNRFLTFSATVVNNTLQLASLSNKTLQPQKLIKKIPFKNNFNYINNKNVYRTNPGKIGIFVNGVELLNYKSRDNIFYGDIKKIEVLSSENDYDIINPPILNINDSIGYGSSAKCSVKGSLVRIDIIDPGFDYLEEPEIIIEGGNGTDAKAETTLVSFEHVSSFNPKDTVDYSNDMIGFSTYHKFRNHEKVIYDANTNSAIIGISSYSEYYVSVQNEFNIKLHNSFQESVLGINTVSILYSSNTKGVHKFISTAKKRKIGSINIKNPGKNYQKNTTVVFESSVNIEENSIKILNNTYKSGELIVYTCEGTPITGLTENTSYYVTKIDDNKIKLSEINTNGVKDLNYKTKNYVNFEDSGLGKHIFNYPEITVKLIEKIGISTTASQLFGAKLAPVFRGKIDSVFVENGGYNYGAEDIINYERQPSFNLVTGSGAQIKPVIANGRIVDILVINPGNNYNSHPSLKIFGKGSGAILTPIIFGGQLKSVKIISGGLGYSNDNTIIEVVSSGSGANFKATINSWNINVVEKYFKDYDITSDDGFIDTENTLDETLQYTHAYAPRRLREVVFARKIRNGEASYVPDLYTDLTGNEFSYDAHSPIIGWAYDGNPIYGPYGYANNDGGRIKALQSGYALVEKFNRPQKSLYPLGFFVDDYEYQNIGDLDEYNGRFCVTPEYPNGIYAYFSTINGTQIESQPSQFAGNIKPVFPYVIGNYFKSYPIEFNFNKNINQDNININEKKWLRNTTPYNLSSDKSNYDYILPLKSIENKLSKVRYATKGNVDFIDIFSGGKNYRVGDEVVFDNDDSGGFGARAKISYIEGKEINNISVAATSIQNVQITKAEDYSYLGFSTVPHGLVDGDLVTINSKYDYNKLTKINVKSNNLSLSVGIDSTQKTGIVTYFYVSGSLNYPDIIEDDIYQIQDEEIKILNIDKLNSRIKVLRNQNGTSGIVSYSPRTNIIEKTRKFTFNVGLSSSYNFNLNKKIYFDPKEVVGLGTTSGVGINTVLNFANPGAGITSVTIPTKALYLPNHNFNTGDELIYSSNGGTPLSGSLTGSSSFILSDNSTLYAVKLSNTLVGISTTKIGIDSTGSYCGIGTQFADILYFTGIGVGNTHSFSTDYKNNLIADIVKNTVTVSTAQTHELSVLDEVTLDCFSNSETIVNIKYNHKNKRLIANPKSFIALDVDIANNNIKIETHNFITGQKVIYNSTTPCGGLEDDKMYYVTVLDKNTFKLCSSYYNSVKDRPEPIDITSASYGTISLVNPQIISTKNNKIIFDLSDPSLSYTINSGINTYTAFNFEIYSDQTQKNQYFISSTTSPNFEVQKIGQIGISTNAKVILEVNQNTPKNLYYNLIPIGVTTNYIITDYENIINNNSIIIIDSKYSGKYSLISVSSTTFSYNILNYPEAEYYDSTNSLTSYYTNSLSAKGAIKEIKLINGGKNYKKLPGISSITTKEGSDAILSVGSRSIGNIKKVKIYDIGFNYSGDYSLRPSVKLPDLFKVDILSLIDKIQVKSNGYHYLKTPTLILIDQYTNKKINDVQFDYNLNTAEVTILKNTNYINNITPKIIPINNSNGIKINNISFNNLTKDVTVSLGASFSNIDDFPFEVGDNVMIEGIGISSIGQGYNSEKYNYALFTLTEINPNIGYAGANVKYNLSNYLNENEIPGTFSALNSYGFIVPEKYFPIFDIKLKKNEFILGETVKTKNLSGTVEGWDKNNGILKISTIDTFKVGDILTGQTSNVSVILKNITQFNSYYNINSYSIVENGWNLNTGFLSDNLQRMHDSDYYQYFSYAVKSHIDYTKWNNTITTLNHSVGFKKFSDLIIESPASSSTNFKSEGLFIGLSTSQDQGNYTGIADISHFVDVNCVNDFDLGKEKLISDYYSNGMSFLSVTLQDYIESTGNRVLVIDDISPLFNNSPRSTPYSIVDTFDIFASNFRKYVILIQDKNNPEEKQIMVVSLLQDRSFGYLNQYGRVESNYDLGYFDFNITNFYGNLLFYPTKYRSNNYYINCLAFNFDSNSIGIATTSLGDIVSITNDYNILPEGTSTGIQIAGISSDYRVNKIYVQLNNSDNTGYYFNEFTLMHDGTDINILQFGDLNSDFGPIGSGIGTFNAYYSGSNINLEFIPYSGLTTSYNCKTFNISIGNTSFTGIGTYLFDSGYLRSDYKVIPASSGITTIASYSKSNNSGSYFIVSVEDTTNNTYQVSELLVLNDQTNAYITEFGMMASVECIGDFDADVLGTDVFLYFNSPIDKDVQIRIFQGSLGTFNDINSTRLDLYGSNITSILSEYIGTENDIIKAFNLKHRGKDIFRRDFIETSVNITKNTIRIPENFFVTGEEVLYENTYGNPIGIATTVISGVSTSILPSTVYIVKLNELDIQVAASATDALAAIPKPLTLYSCNLNTSHAFIARKQNEKCLISIDNNIQKPIVATSITSHLVQNITILDNTLELNNTTNFSGGDTIKINNEIMRINTVGIGSTNYITVERKYLGSNLEKHNGGDIIRKIYGDYNIQNNILNFNSYPYGEYPISSELNEPEERDYRGISTSSSFSGRAFIRSGVVDSQIEPYTYNYIFDDLTTEFTGFKTEFNLKNYGQNVVGFSTSNSIFLIDNIFQSPSDDYHLGNYSLIENSGITSIIFNQKPTTVTYDVNTTNIPSGGVILSVGSLNGLGYQPLVCAGGTAIISVAGTVQSISIGNSGSGYREGVQATVNVGVATTTLNSNIFYIGKATISNGNIIGVAITNPGTGYTSTNPPIVIFDNPLSYSNLKLNYLIPNSGIGTEATVNIVVGSGSSVIDFELKNLGYGYNNGDILTIEYGSTTGIPTDTSRPFTPFSLVVTSTHSSHSVGWSIGDLQIIDDIQNLFDGKRKLFPIKINGEQTTIRSKKGSNVDVQAALIIFINDILQVPGQSYIFRGGSIIEFTEAPKEGDTSKLLFYRGTGEIDVKNVDIMESVKVGDGVSLNSSDFNYNEGERIVTEINSTDDIDTNLYTGSGISTDPNLIRSITWCKQSEDLIVNGNKISKNRMLYEAYIHPVTNIIQNVGSSSTVIYVENLKTFFDNVSEYPIGQTKNKNITIISQDPQITAETPSVVENITKVSYYGDFGIISGVSTTSIGIGSTGLVFDLYIPTDSFLRKDSIVGTGITISNIEAGDYFVVSNTNIGGGVTSLRSDESVIGIGTTFIDNVYQVYSVSIGKTDVLGVGNTYVSRITVKTISGVSGIGYSGYYGNYSWGKITNLTRKNPQSFNSYTNGISGIVTSAIVRRDAALKYQNYSS